ncbi:MAG: glycine C-acetyltransferase [Planctomycetes bacterium]|nr:glycine C-acetyltransferase [Planctomycetota bacterium]MCB9917678.1 glycine C-acetyltransferase [Planctomycetota bacterium]
MYGRARERLRAELDEIREGGLYKQERVIETPQGANIAVAEREVLNFCANNYLGLANDPRLRDAAKRGVDAYGLGLSSVRFICGTQTIHKTLEKRIADFHRKEDTILYIACFDANGGLFEPFLGAEDAIISDALNHASIIDGVRLCKAERYRYEHGDMKDLERCLLEAKDARTKIITTDGVFSMDGDVAKLREICDLAEKHEAMVHVDECHATGFFGPTGRGSAEHCGVLDRVDIITSTIGKALGGSAGGFTTGPREVIDILRQRSRPYLFSNTLPPAIVTAAIECIDILSATTELRDKLERNTKWFREAMTARGFAIKPGEHPIVPIMLGEAKLAQQMAADLLDEGIYVIGFSYPVVPKGTARIRVQVSAAHEQEHLERAVEAFTAVGKKLSVLK